MSIFQRKDRTQMVAEEKILHCIEAEADVVLKNVDDSIVTAEHCRNIKALADAYAAINGWG